jgi:hypothetical protein
MHDILNDALQTPDNSSFSGIYCAAALEERFSRKYLFKSYTSKRLCFSSANSTVRNASPWNKEQ